MTRSMRDVQPRSILCAGCGARLGDLVGDLVVSRFHVRPGQVRRIEGRDLVITCERCGRVWRSDAV